MKKLILVLSIVMFAVFTISAQEKPTTPATTTTTSTTAAPAAVDNPNAPEILFEKTVHDYGTVPFNGDGKCEFKFTNTGKEPLILTNVKSSCGCTVPQWPRQPILPGQSDVIKVEYKTNRVGKINKTVTVTCNAKTPNVVLRIEGQVLQNENTATPENAKPVGTK